MKTLLAAVFSGVLALTSMSASHPQAAECHGKPANTFKVSPSGDLTGVTDWTHIMAAFDQAVAAGPRSTVKLAVGDFYTDRPIEVANFSGTVCGAGKELTRLHTAPGIDFQLQQNQTASIDGPSYMVLYLDSNWPADQTADITVSDLSVYIDGPAVVWTIPERATSPSWGYWNSNEMNVVQVGNQTMGYSQEDTATVKLNVSYRHLKAVGQKDPQYTDGINILRGFLVGGPATGTFTFEDLEVNHAEQGAIAVENVLDSAIQIGGSCANRILVWNALAAVDFQDLSNCKVEVSYLETDEGSGGINVWQGTVVGNILYGNPVLAGSMTLREPSTWCIHYNRFNDDTGASPVPYYFAPINIANFEAYAGYLGNPDWQNTGVGPVHIANNEFNYVDSAMCYEGPIWIDTAGSRVSITNNRFSGRACCAICVNWNWFPTEVGWMIRGNDFKHFDTASWDWPGVDIQLNNASDCWVIGSKDTTVRDFGNWANPENPLNHLIGVTEVP
ncbi:MAG TPA: hypothetical protein VLW52_14175 [Opitutaceae bacterium]|nr:hypothetical protein [Opitutaceae bacterium]